MDTQTQVSGRTRTPEIGGRSWQVMGSVAKCSVPPGHRAPREAQVVTPDPIKGGGWKIAWVFLDAAAGVIAGFVLYSYWWLKAAGLCAAIALPLWVCR